MKKPKIVAMIPARYGSQRFPGKMLAQIAGKSLIQRTYENALRCSSLAGIVIVTDDQRIFEHTQKLGAHTIMTSQEHPSGSDRIAEALAQDLTLKDVDIVINIQGDEPCVDPQTIQKVAEALVNDTQAVMSTAVVPLTQEDATNSSVVKCVIDLNQNALYFSRGLIPHGHQGKMQAGLPYYRHIGIYGFRSDFLLEYAKLPKSPLQIAEDLEQLKTLDHGYKIKVAIVDGLSIGVDRPEDIQKVEQWLCKQNISL